MRCGLYTEKEAPVPLEGVHVEAKIVDMVAEVNVLQFFVNYESYPIEAKYIFPLDSNAAVSDFQIEINDKVIQAQVKEKQEAKAEYQAAIARGDGAYLLEEEKADIFQIQVGNIPASTRATVKISYVVELNNDGDFSTFILPTTIAPRYTPCGSYNSSTTTEVVSTWVPVRHFIPYRRPWYHCWCDHFHWDRYYTRFVERVKVITHHTHTYVPDPSNTDVIAAVNTMQRSEVPYALSLYIEIETPSDIVEVKSGTHEIQTTTESARKATVMFVKDNEPMDKDIIIKFLTKTPHQPRAIIEEGEVNSTKGYAAMVTFVPQFVLNDINAEFIFIVDRSGSMSGSKITQTINAMQLFLRALPANSYFNIIGFGSTFVKLFKESTAYSESSVQTATEHIRTMAANLGGTEILSPLKEVFSSTPVKSYSRQIFLLTDGEVSNTESVIRLVADNMKQSSNFRLFSIGVGSSVSRELVEGIARAGRGTCQIISDGERLEPKVMSQLKQALQPSLTNVRVDWGIKSETPAPVESSERKSAFAIKAPKIGCLIGHRVNEKKSEVTTATRNDMVFQAPFLVPPIFSDKRFIVYAFINPAAAIPTSITIKAESPDGPLDLTLPLERTNGTLVQRLTARSLIRDLEEGTSHLHNSSIRPLESDVKREVVRLGTTYSLVSRYTSFVAVEDRSKERSNWFFQPPPVTQTVHMLSTSSSVATKTGFSGTPLYRSASRGGAPRSAAKPVACSAAAPVEKARRKKSMQEKRLATTSADRCRRGSEEESSDGFSKGALCALAAPCAPPAPSSAPSAPSASSASSPQNTRDRLQALILEQKIDGSFAPSAQLSTITKLSIDQLSQLPSDIGTTSNKNLWCTAIIIAYFESVLAELKDEWELVLGKSKSWLDKAVKDSGISTSSSALIEQAKLVIAAAK